MENERSVKRAVLAAAACEGIYIAIGLVLEVIVSIVTIGLIAVFMSCGSIVGIGSVVLIIMTLVAIPIAYWEYKIAMTLMPKIAGNTPTEILGFRILGWLLIALNVVSFFISVSDNSSAPTAGVVIGILYVRHAKKMDKAYTAAKQDIQNN